jgi:hypothetical protein
MFGKPEAGLRKYRIMNIAILDTVVVIVFSILISLIFQTSLIRTLVVMFLAGIVAHRLFCVRTGLDQALFPLAKNEQKDESKEITQKK